MNIVEAIKEALPKGKGIARKAWNDTWLDTVIIPTNSSECCIVTTFGKHSSAPRWNPTADDLTADDWVLVPKEKE